MFLEALAVVDILYFDSSVAIQILILLKYGRGEPCE
jgi:hypothetical protein